MPLYRVAGVSVEFPHEAYACQIAYMEQVIRALEEGENALLESPTGTGKTLCLLCASLAWLKSKEEESRAKEDKGDYFGSEQLKWGDPHSSGARIAPRTIIYSSRTHSQLAKVIDELRDTSYRPRTCILGSRQQMCIHPTVSKMKGTSQVHACRALVAKQECRAHSALHPWLDRRKKEAHTELLDIEDLVKEGMSKGGACPFYVSRELQTEAELVIMPYNYLVDAKIRRTMTGVDWEGAILIFDEAHNLERVCTDASSFDLSALKLSQCVGEVQSCIEVLLAQADGDRAMLDEGEGGGAAQVESFRVLKAVLCNLEKVIAGFKLPANGDGLTFPGKKLFAILSEAEVTKDRIDALVDQLRAAVDVLEDDLVEKGVKKDKGFHLRDLVDCLKVAQRSLGRVQPGEPPMCDGYRVHIHAPGEKGAGRKQRPAVKHGTSDLFPNLPTLSYWCFLPGIAMRELAGLGVKSIVVTSGTLAPLPSFSHELQLPFKFSIENPHVVDASQVWLGVLPMGPSGKRLNSSYRFRESPEYKSDLGTAIANFSRVVPDGMLVFFPSFAAMHSCLDAWKQPRQDGAVTIWDTLTRYKHPVVEPRQSSAFQECADTFRSRVVAEGSGGSIFFGVCRGKASEGLDFSDRHGRAVVITGIPYALLTDPHVRIKKEVLDEKVKRGGAGEGSSTSEWVGSKLSGDQWYKQQASRAVNQALGRVIRHRHDYGAILLCDERFGQPGVRKDLSKWLQPHCKSYAGFGAASASLARFFRERKAGPAPPPSRPRDNARGNGRASGEARQLAARLSSPQQVDVSGLSSLASRFGQGPPPTGAPSSSAMASFVGGMPAPHDPAGGSQLLRNVRHHQQREAREGRECRGGAETCGEEAKGTPGALETAKLTDRLLGTQSCIAANRLGANPSPPKATPAGAGPPPKRVRPLPGPSSGEWTAPSQRNAFSRARTDTVARAPLRPPAISAASVDPSRPAPIAAAPRAPAQPGAHGGARAFIQLAKSSLPRERYLQLQRVMSAYKRGEFNIVQLCARLRAVFGRTEQGSLLLSQFVQFVPERDKSQFAIAMREGE